LVTEVRLESSLSEATREQVSYGSWLGALLDSYRADPRYLAFTFELEVAADVTLVPLVAEAWARLVRNLIDNALVQPSSRKLVRVEVRRVGDQLHTDVIDFGPGVSPGNREKVFRRFFTLRPEGVPAGTGLGLSIVEAVAAAHRGTVSLLPTEPARGAAFRVSIPIDS
jgi:K+-sensing histidine kinase KdpD